MTRDKLYVTIPDRRKRERRAQIQADIVPTLYSCASEQAVLGALMIDPARLVDIGFLAAEHFYLDQHRRIFRHIEKLWVNSTHPDPVTLSESLMRANELDQAGGFEYIADIAATTPSAAMIVPHARIVRERAVLRSIVALGEEIAALGSSCKPVDDILADARRNMLGIVTEWRDYSGSTARPLL